VTGEITIANISPAYGMEISETSVSITGTGFAVGATAKLGGTNMSAVQTVSESLITATVPAGLAPGFYMVIVVNPDEATATLPNAFEIRAVEVDGETDPGGCSASTHHEFAGLALLLLMLAAAIVWRRVRS